MRTLFLLVFLAFSAACRAGVYVSDEMVFTDQKTDVINAQTYKYYPLINAGPGDVFDVTVELGNAVYRDISAYIVDQANLNLFRQRLPFRSFGATKGIAPFRFRATAWSQSPYFLVLDNSYAMLINKKVGYSVKITSSMPATQKQQTERAIEAGYNAMKKEMVFPDFNINIKPCNQANAFSSPDITLCSELISEMAANNRPGALTAILFHELGHTLLNLWGLPNYDNEDVADEFAAVVLLNSRDGEKALYEVIAWFSEANVRAQAEYIIQHGDRHSLSIQRIRNIERIMAAPEPVIRRWNKVLYPHMTDEALARVIAAPKRFDDPEVAKQELGKRNGSKISADFH